MRVVEDTFEFEKTLRKCSESEKILVVDFYADWCGPCCRIAPQFEALSIEFQQRNFVFVKVNTERCLELSRKEGISALPTFKLYHDEKCIETIVGSNVGRLRHILNEFSLDNSIIQLKLNKNHFERLRAYGCLHKICDRILSHPQEDKFRHISLDSSDFMETLLVVPGCMDFLFSAGFQEADNAFVLPATFDVGRLKELFIQLRSCLPVSSVKVNQDSLELRSSELSFVNRLLEYRSFVVNYMDLELQTRARELIPTEQLLLSASQNNSCSVDNVEPRDFLRELLIWFKSEFFKWADDFVCKTCGGKMVACSNDQPRLDEMNDGGVNVVEIYQCKTNRTHPSYRFPRYNNPRKLLETRLGRCGEWANCFTLFLVSAERHTNQPWFDACRLVMDWTDHVCWLKDKHSDKKIWVHCDPCEVQLDKPLLYESGWNKKINYIMAYTVPPRSLYQKLDNTTKSVAVDIQDVTWRYTQKFSEVQSRRNMIRESVLAYKLADIHTGAVKNWSLNNNPADIDQKPYCWDSIIDELVSFLHPSKCNDQLPGRQTGSLEWRQARGELGQTSLSVEPLLKGSKCIITPSNAELQSGIFHLRYNSALNIYQRPYYSNNNSNNAKTDTDVLDYQCSTNSPKAINQESTKLIENARKTGLYGWQSMVYQWRNIFRKVELDWHMVYLAREEDSKPSEDGIIIWMLDLRNTNYRVGKVSNNNCSASLFNSEAMSGADFLTLKARLWNDDESTGKPSSVAWQQAQLFRQKDSDFDTWSLEWKVELVKINETVN
ncbi:putative peptide n-glycanase (pngase) [Schistosoma mansoni]|uniref:putative peptide n-glycanase (pngase) n=1 Tax=Schistosoma mansoni TaxID=6183 RepID=UPI0001A638C5|nr:putative peptide n-glycanase (pngase) [Schistosoma mansoni]|eukprot:XP_018653575.1 putative peptide n-glycanase (pngase) [Schistosoma mansoni]